MHPYYYFLVVVGAIAMFGLFVAYMARREWEREAREADEAGAHDIPAE